MARSTYIYIIHLCSGVVGAFTVKHECITYLNRIREGFLVNYSVATERDGQPGECISVKTAQEFMAS